MDSWPNGLPGAAGMIRSEGTVRPNMRTGSGWEAREEEEDDVDVMDVDDSGDVSGDGMELSVSMPASLLPASGVSARRRLSRLLCSSRARSRTCSPSMPTRTCRLSRTSSARRLFLPGTSMRSGEKRPEDELEAEEVPDDGVLEWKDDEPEEVCRYVSGDTLDVDLVRGGRGGSRMGEENRDGELTPEW